MSPHLDYLTAGHGRLFTGHHVNGNGDGYHHGGHDGGHNHMAGSLGELFTAGGIVNFLF
jgi:hypothetical protein